MPQKVDTTKKIFSLEKISSFAAVAIAALCRLTLSRLDDIQTNVPIAYRCIINQFDSTMKLAIAASSLVALFASSANAECAESKTIELTSAKKLAFTGYNPSVTR